jgi:hypothetical protein
MRGKRAFSHAGRSCEYLRRSFDLYVISFSLKRDSSIFTNPLRCEPESPPFRVWRIPLKDGVLSKAYFEVTSHKSILKNILNRSNQ